MFGNSTLIVNFILYVIIAVTLKFSHFVTEEVLASLLSIFSPHLDPQDFHVNFPKYAMNNLVFTDNLIQNLPLPLADIHLLNFG